MVENTHFLILAYFAEASIVFNLGYLELKAKEEFNELAENMESLVFDTLSPLAQDTKESICNKWDCPGCTDEYIQNNFGCYTSDHTDKLAKKLKSQRISEYDNKKDFKKRLKEFDEVFPYANCGKVKKWLLRFFYKLVIGRNDRFLTKWSLLLTIFILVLITMLDSNLFLTPNHPGVWMAVLITSLMIFLIIPLIFWGAWGPFLNQFECLSRTLGKAYQKTYKKDFSTIVNKLIDGPPK